MALEYAWLVRNQAASLAGATVVALPVGMLGGGVDHVASKESMGFWEGPG